MLQTKPESWGVEYPVRWSGVRSIDGSILKSIVRKITHRLTHHPSSLISHGMPACLSHFSSGPAGWGGCSHYLLSSCRDSNRLVIY